MRSGKPQVAWQVGARRGIDRSGIDSGRGGRKVSGIHRRDKPLSPARQRFNVTGSLGGVAEHLANPRNRIVQAMVEIDKSIGCPNQRSQLLASDDIAGTLKQSGQDLYRLTLQSESYTVFAQLPIAQIQLETIETQ